MADGLFGELQTTLSGAYRIERELGGGRMSRVFLASEQNLGRPVFLKALAPELASLVSLEHIRRERALVARLQHPNIVSLLSAADANGMPCFTMPFVEGESLQTRMAREHELPVDAVAGSPLTGASRSCCRPVKHDIGAR